MVYPVDSIGALNDSAFWAAYNTPNPLAFRGGQQSVDTTTTVVPSASTNVVVDDSSKSGRAGWILGGLITTGILALGVAGYIKGDKNAKVLQRIWDGVKTIFRNGKNKFSQVSTFLGYGGIGRIE